MIIEEIQINNFRTLTGQAINLHPEMCFIVGENNLGKSNLLDFLYLAFNRVSVP